jgi:hypothetical protein
MSKSWKLASRAVNRDILHRALRDGLLSGVGWAYLIYAYTLQNTVLPHLSLCPLLNLIGLPCPLCGTTRSWNAVLHGDLVTAFVQHPIAPLMLPIWIVATTLLTIRFINLAFRYLNLYENLKVLYTLLRSCAQGIPKIGGRNETSSWG